MGFPSRRSLLVPSKNRQVGLRPPVKEEPARFPYYSKKNWRTESTPSEVEEAKFFLRASLGDTVSPPTEGAWEHFKNNLEPRFTWGGDRYPDYMGNKLIERGGVGEQYSDEFKNASDEFKNAVEALKRQHPIANTVYGYSQDPKMEEGVSAKYYTGTGHISLSGRKGENDNPKGMMNSLRHELAHHLGAEDDFDSSKDLFTNYHPWSDRFDQHFSAYDVGTASDKTMNDIFLPSREEDIREEERKIENFRNNFRLRKSPPLNRDIDLPAWGNSKRDIELY